MSDLKQRWVSASMRYLGVSCYYNSALDLPQGPNDNAVLMICLRINLVPMSAAAHGGFYTGTVHACMEGQAQQVAIGIRMPIREWNDTEWMLFREECCYRAKFWDSRFYLAPPQDYTGLDLPGGTRGIRPYVECRFDPVFVGPGDGPHVRYEVAHLDESKNCGFPWCDPSRGLQAVTRPSNTALEGRVPADRLVGRVDLGLLSSQSLHLKVHTDRDDKGYVWQTRQRSFVHELGHALGMPHSGILFGDQVALAAAQRNPNDCSTYGMGAPAVELINIMGAGDDVAAVNALPWLHRVVMHLNTPTRPQDWGAILRQNGSTLAPRRL
jgi:hypothetical protein